MILRSNGKPFTDGVYNITNDIANTMSALQTNVQVHEPITNDVMDALYKTGIGNKIIRLKTGYALNNTLLFDNEEDETIYNEKIAKKVKTVIKWMMVFGRGIIVLHNSGDNLARPRNSFDPKKCKISVFSGDMISVSDISIDLQSDMYLRPLNYIVRGVQIHHSRVIDFRYVQPVELQLPTYRYGGISEFELIRDQLIADGIISRASTTMLEKSASIFYKVDGFRAAIQNKQDTAIINYFTTLERMRSLYGSGIMDKEDDIEPITQALQNLKETDEIALRRVAMVTGISLIDLVGETPGGLGETGAGELRATRDMVSALQSDYIIDPLNELMVKLGMSQVWFNEAQGQTPEQLVKYESMVVDNATKLEAMGEDGIKYLKDKGIIQESDSSDFFGAPIEGATGNEVTGQQGEEPTGTGIDDPHAKDPAAALLSIMEQVTEGKITKSTAAKIITVAFPLSKAEADNLVSDLEEGKFEEQTENNQEPQATEKPGTENGSDNDGNDNGNGEGLEEPNIKKT